MRKLELGGAALDRDFRRIVQCIIKGGLSYMVGAGWSKSGQLSDKRKKTQ